MHKRPPLAASSVFNTEPGMYQILTLKDILHRIDALYDYILETPNTYVGVSRHQFLVTPLQRLAVILKRWEAEHDPERLPEGTASGT